MTTRGKVVFTRSEANEIRRLIRLKLMANKYEQKKIRDKIRDIGFFYSDFSSSKHGYTVDDFDNLIDEGKIQLID